MEELIENELMKNELMENELMEKMNEIIERIPSNDVNDMVLVEIRNSINVIIIIKLYQLGIIKKEDFLFNDLFRDFLFTRHLELNDDLTNSID